MKQIFESTEAKNTLALVKPGVNGLSTELSAHTVANQPAKLLLTVRECSNLTSLSEKTLLRLIQRGKLRCLSAVRHKRIPAAELARFIKDNLS